MKRVAMISVHECPLASSEGKDRGGINVYTFELSKALTRLGWRVDAFTRIQDDVNPRVVNVTHEFRVIHLPNGPHRPLSKKEILENLPEFTDALTPYVRDCHIIHSHYYLSGLAARNAPVPKILTFHTLGIVKELVAQSGGTGDPPERINLERSLTRTSNMLITSSDMGKEYLASLYGVPAEKIITIPPGVDTNLFRPMNKTAAKDHIGEDHPLVILAVGRIDPVKGFDVLLVALKMLLTRLPNLTDRVSLFIVGGDVDQPRNRWSRELRRLSDLREILALTPTVRFVPPQPQEKLPSYYNAADVLVMPSHYESFGMVALEAMASGTPVIATDVTGISPILKEFPHGHIVSANNPIALSLELEHVLTTPVRSASRPNMAAFTWDTVAKRIAGVYEGLRL